jgi:hypothetical protein
MWENPAFGYKKEDIFWLNISEKYREITRKIIKKDMGKTGKSLKGR